MKRRRSSELAGFAVVVALALAACAGKTTDETDDPAPPDRAAAGDSAAVAGDTAGDTAPDSAANVARDTMTKPPIEDVLAEHTDAWMKIPGVEGAGIGQCEGRPCIKIFVSRPPESFADVLPDSADGHLVRLEPTGPFKAEQP